MSGISQEHVLAMLALQRIDGIGSRKLTTLARQQNVLAALDNGQHRQRLIKGLNAEAKRRLSNFLRQPYFSPEWQMAQQTLVWLERQGASLLHCSEQDFPARLLELDDCPPFLYVRGHISAFKKPMVAIVGTRKPTHVGIHFAEQLAAELGRLGFTVVSGMALGIDSAAHRGALYAKAHTVAVWATGLDIVYPTKNQSMAANITEKGLVVTEMPLTSPPHKGCFPKRNRIISGLSEGVVVVEAGEKSGSMLTARLAMEQNREVFAVPGAINNPQAKGCHALLRDGACLVTSVDDVLDNLSGFISRALLAAAPNTFEGQTQGNQSVLQAEHLSDELAPFYALLSDVPEPFELILSRTQESAADLTEALVDLELMGLIVADAGCYSKA